MQQQYLLKLNLQLFGEEGTGEASAPAAEEQTQGNDVPNPTGDDGQAAAEPGKEDVAFSKRLSAAQEKMRAEHAAELQKLRDEYQNHDTYRKAAEYLQRTSGIEDVMTLKEQIELVELQERADKYDVSPEVQKRIEMLEAKAEKADAMEAEKSQQQAASEFESSLKSFCEGKEIDGNPVEHTELWKYMHENEIGKPEVALKAMKADLLEAKLATAKEDAIKDYLKSKQAPKTDGAPGAAAQTTQTGGGFKGAEARAVARIKASQNAE